MEGKKKIRTHSDLEMSSDDMFLAPQVGLEPTTLRLTAECSAIELLRNIHLFRTSFGISLCGMRRRSTLPGRYQPSTISAWRLNFCVRYGNRWDPPAIATGNCMTFSGDASGLRARAPLGRPSTAFSCARASSRPSYAS